VVTAQDSATNESGNSSEASATPNTIFDDFESGDLLGGRAWLDNWIVTGPVTVVSTDSPQAGTYHLNVDKGSDAVRSANLSGQTNMRLQFWVKINGHKGNSKSYAEVRSQTAPTGP
jgi:hypothetical protein